MLMRAALGTLSRPGERGRLSIFIFHRVLSAPDPLFPDEVDIERFSQILDWIGAWFNVVPLSRAVDDLAAGTLPARAAAITFDDGYADNLLNAAPCLAERGMPASFFIATGFLDGGRMFNDNVIEAVRHTTLDHIELSSIGVDPVPLGTTAEKRGAIDNILRAIKHRPPAARADAVQYVVEACGAILPDDLMLTSTQLCSLAAMDVEIGAHTVNHPILATLDVKAAEQEIAGSRETLEGLLGKRINLFAYPNGKPGQDYLPEHVGLVKRLGFRAAVSTAWGAADCSSDLFQLPRFTPWDRSKYAFFARSFRNLLLQSA
jgi:peptidoglycan/xylan/chitin deacetylase (PgdA/CDA1 family)